jgi:DNA-binding PadR family transcriptional regulator
MTIYRKTIKEDHMQETLALTEASYYILLALYNPQHGYGIMQEVEYLSRGRVRLAAGTLYGALTSMVDKGWIIPLPSADGSRKKNYQITAKGLEILKNEIERLRELLSNGDMILKGEEKDE